MEQRQSFDQRSERPASFGSPRRVRVESASRRSAAGAGAERELGLALRGVAEWRSSLPSS